VPGRVAYTRPNVHTGTQRQTRGEKTKHIVHTAQ